MLGYGEIPERPKGVDCKSIGYAFAGSNPALATSLNAKLRLGRPVLLTIGKTIRKRDKFEIVRE